MKPKFSISKAIALLLLAICLVVLSLIRYFLNSQLLNIPKRIAKKDLLHNYFFVTFLVFSLSIGSFYAFKALLPPRLFPEITVHSDNIAIDSIIIDYLTEMQTDSLPDTLSTEKKDSTKSEVQEAQEAQETQETQEVKEDSKPLHALENFFKKLFALEKTKTGVVRVAFFGDSMTENDLMVYDFRKSYQNKYGGSGRGFAMLSSVIELSGLSRYDFSPEWITHTFLKKKQPVPVGMSGYVSVVKGNTPVWTHFRHRKGAPNLARSELFYGKSSNDSAALTIIANGDTSIITGLETNNILNKLPLTSENSKELMLKFHNASDIPFYGVNFADGDGVYVDNFYMRSSSGAPLSTLNAELMNAFQQEFAYDLIILQFGLNVIQSDITEYSWYAAKMESTVRHLKKCFPGADFLVISSPDKAEKYETEMRTNDVLHNVLRAQKRYAEKSGAGFISLFNLMGGTGSMVKWVNSGMATSDYTHFNQKGAKRAADLIFKHIESEYEEFKKGNKLFEEGE
jgi:hypothetical protein